MSDDDLREILDKLDEMLAEEKIRAIVKKYFDDEIKQFFVKAEKHYNDHGIFELLFGTEAKVENHQRDHSLIQWHRKIFRTCAERLAVWVAMGTGAFLTAAIFYYLAHRIRGGLW